MQENFGISVVEAVSYGVVPILPARLAYPEVLPREFHSRLLYTDENSFLEKWDSLVLSGDLTSLRISLSEKMRPYSWTNVAGKFDTLFEEVLNGPEKNKTSRS